MAKTYDIECTHCGNRRAPRCLAATDGVHSEILVDQMREDLEWAPDRLSDVLDNLSMAEDNTELTWGIIETNPNFLVRGRNYGDEPSETDLPTVVEIHTGGDRFVTVYKQTHWARGGRTWRPAEINWAAIGSVDIATTMKMITQLFQATQVARLMDSTNYDEVK